MNPYPFLVIEHARDDVYFIERAFHGTPARLILCRNISEAKAYLQGAGAYADRAQHPLPVAVSSDFYPGDDAAFELLDRVRNSPATAQIPFFFVSDFILPAQRSKAELIENTYVFEKPLDGSELRSLFITIIGRVLGQLENHPNGRARDEASSHEHVQF